MAGNPRQLRCSVREQLVYELPSSLRNLHMAWCMAHFYHSALQIPIFLRQYSMVVPLDSLEPER